MTSVCVKNLASQGVPEECHWCQKCLHKPLGSRGPSLGTVATSGALAPHRHWEHGAQDGLRVPTPPPAHGSAVAAGPSDPVTMATSLQLEPRSRQTLLQRHPHPHPRTGSGGHRDMETRPGQAEVRGARQIPEGERLSGAGGRRKRDRCREDEIKTEGTESQGGSRGEKESSGDQTTGTGRQAARGGGRAAERRKQRAEGPQGTESGGPPHGLAQEGSKQGEAINQRDAKPPHSAVGMDTGVSQQPLRPGHGPWAPQPCLPLPAPHCLALLPCYPGPGSDIKGHRHGPRSPWHLVSLPPAHAPRPASLPPSSSSN